MYTKVRGTPGRHFREHSFAGKVGFVRDVFYQQWLGPPPFLARCCRCSRHLADNLPCIRRSQNSVCLHMPSGSERPRETSCCHVIVGGRRLPAGADSSPGGPGLSRQVEPVVVVLAPCRSPCPPSASLPGPPAPAGDHRFVRAASPPPRAWRGRLGTRRTGASTTSRHVQHTGQHHGATEAMTSATKLFIATWPKLLTSHPPPRRHLGAGPVDASPLEFGF